ncbi:acetyltransferase [Halomonas organivorans]
MAKVIIFGIGQLAELAHFYLDTDSEHEVVAFTVDREYMDQERFHDLPVVSYEELEATHPPNEYSLFIPISYKKVNRHRKDKFLDAKARGYQFITYISSKASYFGTPVGENCFIMENNVIQPFTEIGDNCILWSGNHVGHHTRIASHCFIASHAVISGSVSIGERCFIGVNATIRDNVNVGRENVLGASCLILSDTEDKSVFPAKATEVARIPSDKIRGI